MNTRKKNVKAPTNKNILNINNYIVFNTLFLFYNVLYIFIHPFQRWFINLYTVELQLDRLPFRVLPNTLKYILIFFVDINSWILFFKRIKNHINLYLIRIKKYPFLHRFWCIFFRNESVYYQELNIKRSNSPEISNFFYKTQKINKFTKKSSRSKYKVIVFYYINKLALSNYPYLYWTYIYLYNRYQYNADVSHKSQHVRTQIFYLFITSFNKFEQNYKLKSFIKFDFYTFKGIKKTIFNLTKIYKYKLTYSKRKRKDKILTKIESQVRLFDKTFLKLYFISMGLQNKSTHKFYINSIINFNWIKFISNTNTILLNRFKHFKIKWYNKVHNSTQLVKKYNIILFLRTAKHFNKGRYSRNRQLYRTGVYWCIWLNIIIVYSLHFYFYRIVYSFGYLWFPIGLLILSIASSRLYKYRYYNIEQLLVEFKEYNNFIFYLFRKIWHVYSIVFKNQLVKLLHFFKNYAFLISLFIKLRLRNSWFFLKQTIFK